MLNYVFNNCFHQKQPPEVFFKIGVHLNFSNFTGKYLCLSLFLIKLQAFRHLRTTASVYMVNQSPPNNKRESKKRNLILSLRKVDSRKINWISEILRYIMKALNQNHWQRSSKLFTFLCWHWSIVSIFDFEQTNPGLTRPGFTCWKSTVEVKSVQSLQQQKTEQRQ